MIGSSEHRALKGGHRGRRICQWWPLRANLSAGRRRLPAVVWSAFSWTADEPHDLVQTIGAGYATVMPVDGRSSAPRPPGRWLVESRHRPRMAGGTKARAAV